MKIDKARLRAALTKASLLWKKDPPEEAGWEFLEIIKETEKAWLIRFPDGDKGWFPKSICQIEERIIFMPKWLMDREIERRSNEKERSVQKEK